MPTTTEQAPVATGTKPTVTYDKEHLKITATVIVSSTATDPPGLSVQAPLIAIPGPENDEPWNVIWQVLPDNTLAGASFDSMGIQIPVPGTPMPNNVKVEAPTPGRPENERQIPIHNGANGANSFRYFIHVQGNLPGVAPMFKKHDPTIVVTPEPIGGTTG